MGSGWRGCGCRLVMCGRSVDAVVVGRRVVIGAVTVLRVIL